MDNDLDKLVQQVQNDKKREIHDHARDLLGEMDRSIASKVSQLFPDKSSSAPLRGKSIPPSSPQGDA